MGVNHGTGEIKIGEIKMEDGKEMWMLWEKAVVRDKVNATTVGDGAILAGSAHRRARARAKGIREVEKVGANLAQALKEASGPPRVKARGILGTHMGDMGTGIGRHQKGMGKVKEIGDKTNSGDKTKPGIQRDQGKGTKGNVGTVGNGGIKGGNVLKVSTSWEIPRELIRQLRKMRMQ